MLEVARCPILIIFFIHADNNTNFNYVVIFDLFQGGPGPKAGQT